MSRRGCALLWGALGAAGCEQGAPVVPPPEPARLSIQVTEGESVAVPVHYEGLRMLESVTIGLAASYQTASAEDVLLAERLGIGSVAPGEAGTVELGLRALVDKVSEGRETLILRPVVWGSGLEPFVRVREDEIEVVITDGPPACSGVTAQVGAPRLVSEFSPMEKPEPWRYVYTTEVVVDFPVAEVALEFLGPPDHRRFASFWRTRTVNAWRVERLGDRVRHQMTVQWWAGFLVPGPALLEMQLCGGPGYGRFIRCDPNRCGIYDEGLQAAAGTDWSGSVTAEPGS